MDTTDSARDRMLLVLLRCALTCIVIAVICGALAVIYYVGGGWLAGMGLKFQLLRPVHTTFASAWIFLGGVTCVHLFLFDRFGAPTAGDRRRFRFQMICWGLAGLGILISVPLGVTSGREYIGFHPAFSLLIVAGWIAFAWTFFSKVSRGFWSRPVYVYMWGTGVLFFLYTFTEGHAWLLPGVRSYPVADLQIQWKSCGTIVASFNMLVYGALIYLGERLSGDGSYARSPKAFVFFGVGILNSFTNYTHHTYHLPQDPLVKWTAFVVSMLEIIILFSIFNDVRNMLRTRRPTEEFRTHARFLQLAKCWTLGLLGLAILISIPPLNTFIHGTHLVMAHAMGSEIAIDSFILFALVATILADLHKERWATLRKLDSGAMAETITWLNGSLLVLVLVLGAKGISVGITRIYAIPAPGWMDVFPGVLVVAGCVHGAMLLRLLWLWRPFLRSAHARTTPRPAARPAGFAPAALTTSLRSEAGFALSPGDADECERAAGAHSDGIGS